MLHFSLIFVSHGVGLCDLIGPTQITQFNIPIFKSPDNNLNSVLPDNITYSHVLGVKLWTSLGGHYFSQHRLYQIFRWLKVTFDLVTTWDLLFSYSFLCFLFFVVIMDIQISHFLYIKCYIIITCAFKMINLILFCCPCKQKM